jgi:orotate phosphoribosyltransferase
MKRNTNGKLVNKLINNGVFIKGEFIGRSGIKLPMYCNLKKSYGNPELLKEIACKVVELLPKNATCIAGLGFGGIPLAVAVSRESSLPLLLIRDKLKDHGTKSLLEGYIPTKKDKIVIVDDVYTTGKSLRDTHEAMKTAGLKPASAVVFLEWNKPSEVFKVQSVYKGRKLKL